MIDREKEGVERNGERTREKESICSQFAMPSDSTLRFIYVNHILSIIIPVMDIQSMLLSPLLSYVINTSPRINDILHER